MSFYGRYGNRTEFLNKVGLTFNVLTFASRVDIISYFISHKCSVVSLDITCKIHNILFKENRFARIFTAVGTYIAYSGNSNNYRCIHCFAGGYITKCRLTINYYYISIHRTFDFHDERVI